MPSKKKLSDHQSFDLQGYYDELHPFWDWHERMVVGDLIKANKDQDDQLKGLVEALSSEGRVEARVISYYQEKLNCLRELERLCKDGSFQVDRTSVEDNKVLNPKFFVDVNERRPLSRQSFIKDSKGNYPDLNLEKFRNKKRARFLFSRVNQLENQANELLGIVVVVDAAEKAVGAAAAAREGAEVPPVAEIRANEAMVVAAAAMDELQQQAIPEVVQPVAAPVDAIVGQVVDAPVVETTMEEKLAQLKKQITRKRLKLQEPLASNGAYYSDSDRDNDSDPIRYLQAPRENLTSSFAVDKDGRRLFQFIEDRQDPEQFLVFFRALIFILEQEETKFFSTPISLDLEIFSYLVEQGIMVGDIRDKKQWLLTQDAVDKGYVLENGQMNMPFNASVFKDTPATKNTEGRKKVLEAYRRPLEDFIKNMPIEVDVAVDVEENKIYFISANGDPQDITSKVTVLGEKSVADRAAFVERTESAWGVLYNNTLHEAMFDKLANYPVANFGRDKNNIAIPVTDTEIKKYLEARFAQTISKHINCIPGKEQLKTVSDETERLISKYLEAAGCDTSVLSAQGDAESISLKATIPVILESIRNSRSQVEALQENKSSFWKMVDFFNGKTARATAVQKERQFIENALDGLNKYHDAIDGSKEKETQKKAIITNFFYGIPPVENVETKSLEVLINEIEQSLKAATKPIVSGSSFHEEAFNEYKSERENILSSLRNIAEIRPSIHRNPAKNTKKSEFIEWLSKKNQQFAIKSDYNTFGNVQNDELWNDFGKKFEELQALQEAAAHRIEAFKPTSVWKLRFSKRGQYYKKLLDQHENTQKELKLYGESLAEELFRRLNLNFPENWKLGTEGFTKCTAFIEAHGSEKTKEQLRERLDLKAHLFSFLNHKNYNLNNVNTRKWFKLYLDQMITCGNDEVYGFKKADLNILTFLSRLVSGDEVHADIPECENSADFKAKFAAFFEVNSELSPEAENNRKKLILASASDSKLILQNVIKNYAPSAIRSLIYDSSRKEVSLSSQDIDSFKYYYKLLALFSLDKGTADSVIARYQAITRRALESLQATLKSDVELTKAQIAQIRNDFRFVSVIPTSTSDKSTLEGFDKPWIDESYFENVSVGKNTLFFTQGNLAALRASIDSVLAMTRVKTYRVSNEDENKESPEFDLPEEENTDKSDSFRRAIAPKRERNQFFANSDLIAQFTTDYAEWVNRIRELAQNKKCFNVGSFALGEVIAITANRSQKCRYVEMHLAHLLKDLETVDHRFVDEHQDLLKFIDTYRSDVALGVNTALRYAYYRQKWNQGLQVLIDKAGDLSLREEMRVNRLMTLIDRSTTTDPEEIVKNNDLLNSYMKYLNKQGVNASNLIATDELRLTFEKEIERRLDSGDSRIFNRTVERVVFELTLNDELRAKFTRKKIIHLVENGSHPEITDYINRRDAIQAENIEQHAEHENTRAQFLAKTKTTHPNLYHLPLPYNGRPGELDAEADLPKLAENYVRIPVVYDAYNQGMLDEYFRGRMQALPGFCYTKEVVDRKVIKQMLSTNPYGHIFFLSTDGLFYATEDKVALLLSRADAEESVAIRQKFQQLEEIAAVNVNIENNEGFYSIYSIVGPYLLEEIKKGLDDFAIERFSYEYKDTDFILSAFCTQSVSRNLLATALRQAVEGKFYFYTDHESALENETNAEVLERVHRESLRAAVERDVQLNSTSIVVNQGSYVENDHGFIANSHVTEAIASFGMLTAMIFRGEKEGGIELLETRLAKILPPTFVEYLLSIQAFGYDRERFKAAMGHTEQGEHAPQERINSLGFAIRAHLLKVIEALRTGNLVDPETQENIRWISQALEVLENFAGEDAASLVMAGDEELDLITLANRAREFHDFRRQYDTALRDVALHLTISDRNGDYSQLINSLSRQLLSVQQDSSAVATDPAQAKRFEIKLRNAKDIFLESMHLIEKYIEGIRSHFITETTQTTEVDNQVLLLKEELTRLLEAFEQLKTQLEQNRTPQADYFIKEIARLLKNIETNIANQSVTCQYLVDLSTGLQKAKDMQNAQYNSIIAAEIRSLAENPQLEVYCAEYSGLEVSAKFKNPELTEKASKIVNLNFDDVLLYKGLNFALAEKCKIIAQRLGEIDFTKASQTLKDFIQIIHEIETLVRGQEVVKVNPDLVGVQLYGIYTLKENKHLLLQEDEKAIEARQKLGLPGDFLMQLDLALLIIDNSVILRDWVRQYNRDLYQLKNKWYKEKKVSNKEVNALMIIKSAIDLGIHAIDIAQEYSGDLFELNRQVHSLFTEASAKYELHKKAESIDSAMGIRFLENERDIVCDFIKNTTPSEEFSALLSVVWDSIDETVRSQITEFSSPEDQAGIAFIADAYEAAYDDVAPGFAHLTVSNDPLIQQANHIIEYSQLADNLLNVTNLYTTLISISKEERELFVAKIRSFLEEGAEVLELDTARYIRPTLERLVLIFERKALGDDVEAFFAQAHLEIQISQLAFALGKEVVLDDYQSFEAIAEKLAAYSEDQIMILSQLQQQDRTQSVMNFLFGHLKKYLQQKIKSINFYTDDKENKNNIASLVQSIPTIVLQLIGALDNKADLEFASNLDLLLSLKVLIHDQQNESAAIFSSSLYKNIRAIEEVAAQLPDNSLIVASAKEWFSSRAMELQTALREKGYSGATTDNSHYTKIKLLIDQLSIAVEDNKYHQFQPSLMSLVLQSAFLGRREEVAGMVRDIEDFVENVIAKLNTVNTQPLSQARIEFYDRCKRLACLIGTNDQKERILAADKGYRNRQVQILVERSAENLVQKLKQMSILSAEISRPTKEDLSSVEQPLALLGNFDHLVRDELVKLCNLFANIDEKVVLETFREIYNTKINTAVIAQQEDNRKIDLLPVERRPKPAVDLSACFINDSLESTELLTSRLNSNMLRLFNGSGVNYTFDYLICLVLKLVEIEQSAMTPEEKQSAKETIAKQIILLKNISPAAGFLQGFVNQYNAYMSAMKLTRLSIPNEHKDKISTWYDFAAALIGSFKVQDQHYLIPNGLQAPIISSVPVTRHSSVISATTQTPQKRSLSVFKNSPGAAIGKLRISGSVPATPEPPSKMSIQPPGYYELPLPTYEEAMGILLGKADILEKVEKNIQAHIGYLYSSDDTKEPLIEVLDNADRSDSDSLSMRSVSAVSVFLPEGSIQSGNNSAPANKI